MIVFQRTADIAPGKLKEAMVFAFKAAAKASDLVGAKVEVLVPYAGNPLRITWQSRHNGLADVEKGRAALMADSSYMELITAGGPNFVPSSMKDELWLVEEARKPS